MMKKLWIEQPGLFICATEKLKKTSVSSLLLAAWLSAQAQADTSVTGYIKSFAVAQDSINTPIFEAPELAQSQNTARLMLEGFEDTLVWQIHYEVSPVIQSRSLSLELPTFNVVGDSYRLSDPDNLLAENGTRKRVYQNLDRFNLQFQFDAGDLTIGRQAIAFGSARMINPTDVFLPFDVRTFNTEYRTGVDAIRFQKPWGELGEIDMGLVFGDGAETENSAAFLQLRGNHNGKDLHLALVRFAEQSLVGAGLATALGDFGFWLEVASVTGDEDYIRASTGLDYAFTEHVFAQVEYHHNGAGSSDAEDYLENLSTLPYQKGGVFLLGRDYLIPAVSAQLSPLWVLGLQAVINLSDSSAFVTLSTEFNVAENFYMDFGYYHFSGDGMESLLPGIPQLESEYGDSPDTLYASIRYYF
jgi:hypothetical protein